MTISRERNRIHSPVAPGKPNAGELRDAGSSDAVDTLTPRFRSIVCQATDEGQLRFLIVKFLSSLPGVAGVAWTEVLGKQVRMAEHTLTSPVFERDEITSWIHQSVAEAIAVGTGVTRTLPLIRNLRLYAQPLDLSEGDEQNVLVMLVANETRSEVDVLTLQLAAAWSAFWSQSRDSQIANQEVNVTSTLVEIGAQISECDHVATLGSVIAKEVKKVVDCDLAVVGLATGSSGQAKVLSLSEHRDFDLRADIVQDFSHVFEETIARNRVTSWPATADTEQFLTKAHQKLVVAGKAESVLSTPLHDKTGKTIGAIAVLGNRAQLGSPVVYGMMDALSEPLGRHLAAVKKRQGGWVRQSLRAIAGFVASLRMLLLLVACAVLILIMLIPVPHNVWCNAVMQPVERRYSVAPQDGLLESTLFEPGDVVEKGQLLATMDGREIRWDMAGTIAGKQKAEQERDAHMASYEMPSAVIAGLETERMQHELNVLAFREKNLSVRSPIDGVILDGSLDRRENYPVSSGDVIYEVAPLSVLRAEVSIDAEDITHTTAGQEVELYVNGLEGDSVNAVIKRIRPRSEIIDSENVFVAEVTVENPDGLIRPGMTASARIKVGKRELWWVLFHRAIENISTALHW